MDDGVEMIEVETAAEKNLGGVAPPHRQCRRILESGERCRDWEVRGQGFCFRHGRWEGTRRQGPITVPLMEDAESIRMVVSQTVRAMSLGTIPPSNGRVILMGCREARGLLQDKLAEKRLAAQMKRWNVVLEDPALEPTEVVERNEEWLAPVYDEREVLRKWEVERAAEHAARDQARAAAAAAAAAAAGAAGAVEKPADSAPVDASAAAESGAAEKAPGMATGSVAESVATESVAEPVSGSAAEGEPAVCDADWAMMTGEHPLAERSDANDPPEPDALWLPNSTAKFRDLKKNWDMALNRSENERRDMYFKRYGETPAEFQEARQRPYEAYFEEAGNRE